MRVWFPVVIILGQELIYENIMRVWFPVVIIPGQRHWLLVIRPEKNMISIYSWFWIHYIPIAFPVLLSFCYQFTRDSYRVAYGVKIPNHWNKCFSIPIYISIIYKHNWERKTYQFKSTPNPSQSPLLEQDCVLRFVVKFIVFIVEFFLDLSSFFFWTATKFH